MADNAYETMKRRQHAEINDFPMFFAFTDKQFAEGMAKFGLDAKKESDLKLICRGPAGMFLRKSDAKDFKALTDRHKKELDDAMAADKTGNTDGFMYQAFTSELFNHEYGYTGDTEDALAALGISSEALERNSTMRKALDKACRYVMKNTF